MNTQTNKTTNKTSIAKRIVTLANLCAAILLTVTWFLPVVQTSSRSYTMLKALDKFGGSEGAAAMGGFIFIVILYAIAILWAAIPKKWAAIVGIVYSFIPLAFCIVQISDWKSHSIDLAFGGILMIPLAILVLALSVAKLVCLLKDGKQHKSLCENPAAKSGF